MRPAEDIKKLIKNASIKTSPEVDKAVLNSLLDELDKSKERSSAALRPNVWRIIMKSQITKFATAAVIIIAVMVSITFLDKSIPPAYALEQTIQASHSVRHLHIREINPSYDEPILIWAEFDHIGQVANLRLQLPEWSEGSEGAKVVTWKNNKAQVWVKKKNVLVTIKEKTLAAKIYEGVKKNDPKYAVERLQQEQEQGKIEIEINEPVDKAKPIIVTGTYSPESPLYGSRKVLFIDQSTKLVTSIEFYEQREGREHCVSILEYHDYNQPIAAEMFMLEDEIPADALRIDQTTQEVGLTQGNLTDNEIAVEVVRQFLEALIARDYAKAGRLFSGTPAERMEKAYGQIRFIRIISIGEPAPHSVTGGLYVPCTVEIEENGEISQWQPEHSYVRQVHGQAGRWEIIGGFRGI